MNAKREGLERIVKGAAKVADDWGWSPSQMKPGEISGTEFNRRLSELTGLNDNFSLKEKLRRAESVANSDFSRESDNAWRELTILSDAVQKQRDRSKYPSLKTKFKTMVKGGFEPDAIYDLERFKIMEDAGIPRKWTGKIADAMDRAPAGLLLHNGLYSTFIAVEKISDIMRLMTNEQRQTFLNLLPKWTGTLETAASAAKKLYRRPS
jgi:hypothetical protein